MRIWISMRIIRRSVIEMSKNDDVLSGAGWNKSESAKKDANNIIKIIVGIVIGIIVISVIIFGLTMKGTNEAIGGKKTIEDLGVEDTSERAGTKTIDDLGVESSDEKSVSSGVTITIEGDTLFVKNATSGELIDTWIYTIQGADVFYKCDNHPGVTAGSDVEVRSFYDDNANFVVVESSDYTPDELNIRNTLDADLQKMQTDLDTISEYKTRLESLGIQVPDLPEMIAGDVIKNNNGIWELQVSLNGGVMYEWQNHSLNNGGYIEGASADDIQSMIDSARYDVAVPEFDTHWYYTDGTEFILSQDGFSQTSTDIQNAITGYEGACNAYVADKTKYQCTDLISLLELEISYKKSN